eukprot:Skav220432  [mRNA]  locus=scaffold639:855494:877512:+ [translate_table: standard]
MQTKLQGMVRESEDVGAETEAAVKRIMKKVGLTDEVIRTELVWVRLYRDAMERIQRMAARREEKREAERQAAASAASPETNAAYPAVEEFLDPVAAYPGPLDAWLSPSRRNGNGSPVSASGSPKRRNGTGATAFLEPETSQVQILQAPRRCVRKLQNSRSAPAIPR